MTLSILLAALFLSPEEVPVAFNYDGREIVGLGGLEVVENTLSRTGGVLRVSVDDVLQARVEAKAELEYGSYEYVMWLVNVGGEPTKDIRNVRSYKGVFVGERPRLRGIHGDHVNHYGAYELDLAKADCHISARTGRATHVEFPYFDLVHGDGGTLIALGWAGTWEATFSSIGDKTHLCAQACLEQHFRLLPGERFRTARMVLVPYSGRDQDAAMNKWRRWFLACNAPKANAKGDSIRPFSTAFFAYDTGLPNSDGSISERSTTWKQTLDKLVKERVVPDFRWLDAGWYADPAGNTVESDWRDTVGAWKVDPVKWPGDSLRKSNEACHELGMKVFAWFEPERVSHVDDLVRRHGYRREWAVEHDGNILNNIGDDECRAWTLKRIVDMMEANAVDLYREDYNIDPWGCWWKLQERDLEAHPGIPRWGLTENRCVEGHYRLWDDILRYCASNGKCTFIDSCASGGGRNDIESLKRAIPFLRSDDDRTTTSVRLSMSSSFNRWIPFNGASTKDVDSALVATSGSGGDSYVGRASLLPIWHISEAFSRNENLNWDWLRRNFYEWKSVRNLLLADFYVLTPWHDATFRRDWTVFAYDSPEQGESILLAFRQEECEADTFTARLKFADVKAEYELLDVDEGTLRRMNGGELRRGLEIRLDRPRSSKFFRIKRVSRLERIEGGRLQNAGITVDDKLPAGNVIVDGIDGDVVRVRQDLRDSPDWIYWAFRTRGAAGRTVRFEFDDRYAGGPVSARGPAVSKDRGKTWTYAAEKNCSWKHFVYTFRPDEDETWFSQTIPYYPSQWDEFLMSHDSERGRLFASDMLCLSRKGRTVPYARFGRIDGSCRYRIFLASRHHCAETMATYVLEGIVAQVFADTPTGRWLRDNVEIMAVPFVDYDGVVDGDQGKRRRPHDHCRDYDKLIYPETSAIVDWALHRAKGKIDVWFDLHCPWVHGEGEEYVFQVLGQEGKNTDAQRRFGGLLERLQSGVLCYRQSNDFPWNYAWNGPQNYKEGWTSRMWAEYKLPDVLLADSWEIPFATANGTVVDAKSCRAFGADMANALYAFLCPGADAASMAGTCCIENDDWRVCADASGALTVSSRKSPAAAYRTHVPQTRVTDVRKDGESLRFELEAVDGVRPVARVEFDGASELKLTLSADADARMRSDVVWPGAWVPDAGDTGVYPFGEGMAYPVADTNVQLHAEWGTFNCGMMLTMGFFGFMRGDVCVMTGVRDNCDTALVVSRRNGLLEAQVRHQPEYGRWGYDREMRVFLGGGIGGVCKQYRSWRERLGMVRTLAEKARETPGLLRFAGTADVWLWDENVMNRLYGRPMVSTRVPRDAVALAREMKALGMERVLWNDIEDGSRAVGDELRRMGYMTGKYDVYRDVLPPEIADKVIPYRRARSVFTPICHDIVRILEDGTPAGAWAVHGLDGKMYDQQAVCDLVTPELTRRKAGPNVAMYKYDARLVDVQSGMGAGECYSPRHPCTRRQGADAIRRQNRYLSDELHQIVGVEVGGETSVSSFHYSEGLLSSPSEYRLENAGRRMTTLCYGTNVTPTITKYLINPRYRIPLWELVYHDCSVSYWYWGDSQNSCPELMPLRDLFCALYGVPPLYSLDTVGWERLKHDIAQSYKRATPVARETMFSRMTDWWRLTADALVQRVRFANGVTVTVNFSDKEYALENGGRLDAMSYCMTNKDK